MRNVQQRLIPADPEKVGVLLNRLDDPALGIWPGDRWSPLRLDNGLAIGSTGGHGPIRYTVAGHEAGQRLTFRFRPEIGVDGTHAFEVTPAPGGTLVRHTIDARTHGRMILLWPLMIRWLHGALLQDLLANWERAATGTAPDAPRWSPGVRLLRRLVPRPARTATSEDLPASAR